MEPIITTAYNLNICIYKYKYYIYNNQSCNTWMLDLLTSLNLLSPVKNKHVNFICAVRPTGYYTFTEGLVMSFC